MSEQSGDRPRLVSGADGEVIFNDPLALAVIKGISKRRCRDTLQNNADNVAYYKRALYVRGLNARDAVIAIVSPDDPNGAVLADILMPGRGWLAERDRGEVPYARGLVQRDEIQILLDIVDQDASAKLKEMTSIAVIVIDHGVAEVFPAL